MEDFEYSPLAWVWVIKADSIASLDNMAHRFLQGTKTLETIFCETMKCEVVERRVRVLAAAAL